MNGFFKSLLVACALVQVSQAVYPMSAPNTQSLAHLFFRSRLANQDPEVSMACFTDYIFKSNEVGESYGNEYNQCLVDAKAGRKGIESEMADKRIDIAQSSENVCKRLSTCNGLNTTLEIFNCHAKIGANNTKAVYGISGNASEYANIMQEKYRIIDLRHEQCCKLAERTYVEATAVNYRTLQDCLEGRVKPSTTTTTSEPTTTTTTTTTTPEPTTTPTTTSAPSTTGVPTTTGTSTTTDVPTTSGTSTTTLAPSTTGGPTSSSFPSSTTPEQPASSESPIGTNPPDVESPVFPPGTEEFAKLLQLFK